MNFKRIVCPFTYSMCALFIKRVRFFSPPKIYFLPLEGDSPGDWDGGECEDLGVFWKWCAKDSLKGWVG